MTLSAAVREANACGPASDTTPASIFQQPARAKRQEPGARNPSSLTSFLLALLCTGLLCCGKKGDPQAPVPRGPNAIADLSVEQEGSEAVLAFTFPDRLSTGEPLRDLAVIEIYRVASASPAVVSPPAAGASGPRGAGDRAPASGARRAAASARVWEQTFYRAATKIASLTLPDLAQRTRGATIVFRDPLGPLFPEEGQPQPLAYAAVSVRRNGERSPLSNIVRFAPAVPPGPPLIVRIEAEDGRICLEWTAPAMDVIGRPAQVGGYHVYRRTFPEEEYGAPLTAAPVSGTAYVDATAPYGATHVYTVRATLPDRPHVEGLAAEEVGLEYRDVFSPSAPARLDALPEEKLVRLIWDPVAAPDLAGYLVFRAEGDGPPSPVTRDPIADTFYADESVETGKRYRYTVVAIDSAGNRSVPSPEALAETF